MFWSLNKVYLDFIDSHILFKQYMTHKVIILLHFRRKLADEIAAAGYFVVTPDYFSGDVFIPGVTDRNEWFKKHNPVSTQTS